MRLADDVFAVHRARLEDIDAKLKLLADDIRGIANNAGIEYADHVALCAIADSMERVL